MNIEPSTSENFSLFRDCLAAVLIERASRPTKSAVSKSRARRKESRKDSTGASTTSTAAAPLISGSERPEAAIPAAGEKLERRGNSPSGVEDLHHGVSSSPVADNDDNEDLSDFILYLADETFPYLPAELQTLSHHVWAADADLRIRYDPATLTSAAVAESILPSLPLSVPETLSTYSLVSSSSSDSAYDLLLPALVSYLSFFSTPPPPPRSTLQHADGCEMCERSHIPLTYHHLVPRMVHDKVVKRGWRRKDELQNVAWLCRACHSFVHRFADHESLARYYYTIELLMEQEEVRRFAKWAAGVRWKKR